MQQENSGPRRYVRDLRDGDMVQMPLLIAKMQLRDKKDGGKYIAVMLADRTGKIDGRIWDNANHWYGSHAEGQVVIAKGNVKAFEGRLQLMVGSLRQCGEGEFEPADFLPATDKDRDSMVLDICIAVDEMREGPIRRLMKSYVDDDAFMATFAIAPGAVSVHHNYLGGLLEHTHAVVNLCLASARLYPGVDRDLLVAGAILHDIGKMEKYRYDTVIDMSDKGHFMGHIALGTINLSERMSRPGIDMPEETRLKLMHLVLSHHGSLEWGSPVEPKTLEALLLHFADNMDAKANQFSLVLKTHSEPGRKWTNYDQKLGRSLYSGIQGQPPGQTDGGE